MESFSIHYDPNFSTKRAYLYIQEIQTLLFTFLTVGTKCSSSYTPILSVKRQRGETRIDVSALKDMENNLKLAERSAKFISAPITYLVETGGHYGGAFIDIDNQSFVIYDPSYAELVKDGLMSEVIKAIEKVTGYKYIEIPCFMDFQHMTNDYYCSLWTLLIMYLACKNNGNIQSIVEHFSHLPAESLNKEINGFIKFVYHYMEEKGLVKEAEKVQSFIRHLALDKSIDPDTKQQLLVNVKFSSDPVAFIEALALYDLGAEGIDIIHDSMMTTAQQMISDRKIINFMEALIKPMTLENYIKEVNYIYESKRNYSRDINKLLSDSFPETTHFIPYFREASKIIEFNFSKASIDISLSKLKQSFCKFYDISTDKNIMFYTFIFEFYLRFFILDTYDIPDNNPDVSEYRIKKYIDYLTDYNIIRKKNANLRIIRFMMNTPVKYIRMKDFLSSLPYKIEFTNEELAYAMASNSLLKSASSYKIYYQNCLNFLNKNTK